MRSSIDRLLCAGLLFAPALLLAAETEPARRFAAPDLATAPASGGAAGLGQVTLALLVVLAAVFALAWLLKRLRRITGGGSESIEVLAQASLGSKERAVIVRVAGARLLLGVASGQVSLLQTLPPEAGTPPPAATDIPPQKPNFIDLLQKSLGK
jgi:flagellar protein FliO/FliZ